ncbi:winged helix-turn-helix transcriptional regulator [[Mycobacterium] wendilense]|uniref:Winged helix-turn-helix transcriptional regulator n=1 Tax=[Mycobacterium] wendilense TaxID=3064284 RepID=A0ABN9P8W0_9MYCO|nr:winged helix-turn-helix transcriptional regulator [Mycolicibacterium sp. MU0050]CAJ1587252.1 winged helix-turn-helix transcriptional regulator [Mycolicibacterium sp. MU0050]
MSDLVKAAAPLSCSVFGATEAIGDAWSWLLLSEAIIDDTRRFDAFQSRLQIARSTLSARLSALCANGLMVQDGRDYTLTAAGADFFTCAMTAMAWGDRWCLDGAAAPTRVAHLGCRDQIRGELRCAACNEVVLARDVSFSRRPEALESAGAAARHRAPNLDLLQRPRRSSIAATLQVIGDRWSALIIRELFYGSMRFEDFLRHLGIASNILSQRLQRLVDHGIVGKHPYQTRPPRHEYRLTAKGLDLYPVPLSMLAWGDRWLASGQPPVRLAHLRCDAVLTPRLSCSECARPITRADVSFEHRD